MTIVAVAVGLTKVVVDEDSVVDVTVRLELAEELEVLVLDVGED